jgi:putative tricarboxylic transport membrane protein
VTRPHPDAIGVAVILAIAIATIAGGVTTPDPGFGVVSPAVFPVVLGVLMLASAAWLAFDTVRGGKLPELEALDGRPLAATAIATAVFLATFVPVGFVITGTAFLIVGARVLGSATPVRDAIASLVFILALYWLFVGFLKVPLPNGPLPF